jgi:3-dehydroquinate dehydratase
MDKEILELLKKIDSRLSTLEEGQKEINKKLDGVVEQTADLVEFRQDMITKVDGIREDLATVELVTAKNYKDIVNLKAIK